MRKIFLLLLLLPLCAIAQLIKINGSILDQNNRGIENASVVVYDKDENIIVYERTDVKGIVELRFEKKNLAGMKIEITSLGFLKKELELNLDALNESSFTVKMLEDIEVLKEVVIQSDQKIRIDQDTTFIKVDKFVNKTEQTLEDVLKKLPGIKIEIDGTIKAHGRAIDKLLVDGEDVFDKNYKLLSKNLDAKVLDEVQILDNFEDNPILKKLSDSDKVALNIKFKKGFTNVWFGNIAVGLGTKNRFKESLNLGLLRKKIKFFYFADYNNIGEKSTNLILNNQESIDFSDFNNRVVKKAKTLYSINSNDNNPFIASQSLFNKALLNSLSANTRITKKIKLRAVGYFLNDVQQQNSNAFTAYNIEPNPINISEKNVYTSNKTLASTELELKYLANSKSYFTNYFSYQNNPDRVLNNLVFNQNLIDENLKNKNESFDNHFQNTYSLSNNAILSNYFYFGTSKLMQNATIKSDLLNDFLENENGQNVLQQADNSLSYFGHKIAFIVKKNNLISNFTLHFENSNELFKSVLSNPENEVFLMNDTGFKQNTISFYQNHKFFITKQIQITSKFNVSNNSINNQNFFLLNPSLDFDFSMKRLGSLSMKLDYNSKLPDTNILSPNNQLSSYRSFTKGTDDIKRIYGHSFSVNYSLFKTIKRFSVEASFLFFKTASTYNTENTLSQNFNQNSYFIGKGGQNTMAGFGLTNYFRKLKLATKIETDQNWFKNPLKINSDSIELISNYFGSYKISGTTFFKKFINFDFGYNYNVFQSGFKSNVSKGKNSDYYVTVNHIFNEIWISELKYNFYNIDSKDYTFINASLSYLPRESHFSYSLLLNNLANENTYSTQSISSYSYFKTTIDLVPRYLLFSTKYRF